MINPLQLTWDDLIIIKKPFSSILSEPPPCSVFIHIHCSFTRTAAFIHSFMFIHCDCEYECRSLYTSRKSYHANAISMFFNLGEGAKEFYLKNPTPIQGAAHATSLGSIDNTKPGTPTPRRNSRTPPGAHATR